MTLIDFLISLVFFISLVGLLTSQDVIKSIVCVMVMQTSVILFWLAIGAREGSRPPIINEPAELVYTAYYADPLPQALMMTAIVIGISVTAVMITMLNYLIRRYNTSEWASLREVVKAEHSED